MDAREKVVAVAETLAGLGYAPATRAAYLDVVAPLAIEGPELEAEMGSMWSCALTTLGLWRKVGVQHALLSRKYEIGKAMAWVSQVGEDKGAERYPDGASLPGLGDAVEVNAGQHVVAAIVAAGPSGVSTIEGGQIDAARFMCVGRFGPKRLAYVAGVLYLGQARVLRWYAADALGVPLDFEEDEVPTGVDTPQARKLADPDADTEPPPATSKSG